MGQVHGSGGSGPWVADGSGQFHGLGGVGPRWAVPPFARKWNRNLHILAVLWGKYHHTVLKITN